MDNCTAHAPKDTIESDDGTITVMFLPPNVTSLLQPMDQNPINITKLMYRNSLLATIIAKNVNQTVTELLKAISIKDAIILLNSAWDKLPTDVLIKSWKKMFQNFKEGDENFEEEDNIPLAQLMLRRDFFDTIVDETCMLIQQINPEVSLENSSTFL